MTNQEIYDVYASKFNSCKCADRAFLQTSQSLKLDVSQRSDLLSMRSVFRTLEKLGINA